MSDINITKEDILLIFVKYKLCSFSKELINAPNQSQKTFPMVDNKYYFCDFHFEPLSTGQGTVTPCPQMKLLPPET